MRRLLCRWFGWFCPKVTLTPPAPVIVPVTCVHAVVSHKSAGDLDELKALGVKKVRLTYYVRNPDNSHWTWHLPLFDAAGIEPMIVVHDFDSMDQSVEVMRDLTTRFPGRRWQIGNEYNFHGWSKDDFAYHGGQYAVMMQRIIAACPPGTRFVGCGLAFNFDQVGYLRDYLAAGGPILEAWAIHAYGVPVVLDTTVRPTQAMLAGKMPLLVTEYGINRADQVQAWGPRTDAQIAEEQRRTLVDVTSHAGALGVSETYWYCLSGDLPFALVDDAGIRSPAWLALQAAAQ